MEIIKMIVERANTANGVIPAERYSYLIGATGVILNITI